MLPDPLDEPTRDAPEGLRGQWGRPGTDPCQIGIIPVFPRDPRQATRLGQRGVAVRNPAECRAGLGMDRKAVGAGQKNAEPCCHVSIP